MKSKILVFVQFAAILLLALPLGTPAKHFAIGMVFIVVGLVVGVLALRKNTLGNFNIRPDIKEDCTLITDGIYAYIRHPMYTSVLVSTLGLTILYYNVFTLSVYAVLVLNMLIKMFYEESLWKCHSGEYLEYTKNTSRLIPKVF